MRTRFLLPMLMFPASVLADGITGSQEMPVTPPAYKVLRFDEDYSYLSNSTNRTDFFDPLKYVSLDKDDPSIYLTLGGELRERFEGMSNPGFGLHGNHDDYWLQRATLIADLHLGDRVRVYTEGISGLDEGNTLPAPPVQRDPADLQFAFVDVLPYLNGAESVTLRGGRFGLSFGSGRLVATRAAPNIPFRFDGGEAIFEEPYWESTAFITQPVIDSGSFDGSDHTVTFWGLYNTHWFDSARKDGLDFYYLGIHREHGAYASGTGDEMRHSLGLREFGDWHHWDWNGEGVVQFGTFGDESIFAWTASLDSGYTFDTTFQPRLGIKADVTSGDTNPNDGRQGTFDALFFKSGYFNDASLLRPQNIIDVHPNLGLKLTSSAAIDGGGDIFWRYSQNDAVYAVPGFIAIPAQKSNSTYVGTALDVNLTWQIQRHVTWQASYVHFFAGSYVEQSGGTDVDYVSTTLSFLF